MENTNNNANEHKNNIIQFASLVNLAFIDNIFDKEEFELLSTLSKKLGITDDERIMVLDNPDVFAIEPITSFNKRLEFIYDFFKIIYADDKLDDAEYQLVRKYIQAIGFNLVNTKMILNKSIEIFERNDGTLKEEISLADYESLVFNEEET